MPIINMDRYFVGTPNIVGVVTTDTLSVITSQYYFLVQAPYVSEIQNGEFEFSPTDIILIFYSGGIGFFTYDATNQTFTPVASSGEVVLPVTNGHFANFIGTSGAIGDLNFRPSNAANPVVTTTNTGNGTPNGFVPAFIGTDGTIGLQEDSSFYKFNGYVYAGDNATSVMGSCVSSCGVPDNALLYLTSLDNPAGNDSSILSAETLGQVSNYNLPDAGVINSTFAVFPALPSVITPGNIIVAGTVNGTLADGGSPSPGAPAVLLTPADDQVITQNELTIAEGQFNLGVLNTNSGTLTLFNANGAGSLNVIYDQPGLGADVTLNIVPADDIAQTTAFTIPDPGNSTATFALFPVNPVTITPGNILVAGTDDGTIVDGGTALSNAVLLTPSGDQVITAFGLRVASGGLSSGTASTTLGEVQLFTDLGTGSFALLPGMTGGDPANSKITLTTDTTYSGDTTYYLPDPGVPQATVAVFPEYPASPTPGHFIVAGSLDGNIVDGGIGLDGVVLLDPIADQVIVAGQLVLEPGGLILGKSGVNEGLLLILNDAGTGTFSIYSGQTGVSADFDASIATAPTLGQSTTYTIPDPGATTATFNVTATSVTAGNILVAGASDGVLVDSGVAVSQLELVSNMIAQQTGNIGAAGAGPLTITQVACTTSSIITANVVSSSNPCFVQSITAANGSFDVVMSADPGASLILNYVMFVSAQ